VVDIIRAFSFPQKYKENLPIDKIVADGKVVEDGVSHYHEKIERGHEPKPLIVIKHPKEDIYAVLDGHHRFEAMKKLGMEEVPAVVVDSYTNLQFKMTKKGYFQPSPLLTKYIRIPIRKFAAFMKEFLENPWQMLGK